MFTPSLILDITAAALLLLCAIIYAKKGFASGLVNFLGTLAALIIAGLFATNFSPVIFDNFFRPGLEKNTAAAISAGGVQNINDLLKQVVGFLPDSVIRTISEQLGSSLDFSAADIANQVVTTVIAPLVIPIIAIVIFFVAFLLMRVIIGVLSNMLQIVNKVPLLGSANRLLGIAMGLLIGVLYAYIAFSIIWAVDVAYSGGVAAGEYFSSSFAWNTLYRFNVFAL